MSNTEARKMSPEELSGPESARKMESGAEKAESKKESAGDRFLSDTSEYAVLNARAEAKRMEIKDVERKIPLGIMTPEAKAALEGELKTMYGAMDKVSDKYGDDAWSFRFDAMNLGDLNAQIEKKKSRLAEISKIDSKDWNGGEKGQEMIMDALQSQIAKLGGESSRLEQKLKQNYEATEEARRAEVRSISDAEIDTLLAPMDEQIMDVTEAEFMAKGDQISAKNTREAAIFKAMEKAVEEGRAESPADEVLSVPEMEQLAKFNELPIGHVERLKKDVERVKTELFELKAGLAEAEDELRKYGVNPDTLSEAKDSASMVEAFKKETSFFSRIKKGLKFLTNPGYRVATETYNQKSEAILLKQEEVAQTELALTDPMRAADLASRRVLRNIVRNASNKGGNNNPRGILSM